MPNDPTEPTQPLTDELAAARAFANGEIPASPEAVQTGREIAASLLAEVDRLRAELEEAHRTAGAEHGRAGAMEAAYREVCTARDARDAEIERLRAENTALEADRDAWKANAIDAYLLAERRGKARGIALNADMRREIVLREINQGALAGMSSEITGQAADLVLKALNDYDTWQADTAHWAQDDAAQESDRARAEAALDQSGEATE